jgi:hypothetical protein
MFAESGADDKNEPALRAPLIPESAPSASVPHAAAASAPPSLGAAARTLILLAMFTVVRRPTPPHIFRTDSETSTLRSTSPVVPLSTTSAGHHLSHEFQWK